MTVLIIQDNISNANKDLMHAYELKICFRSLAAVRARVRQEMEAEKLAASSALSRTQRNTVPEVVLESVPQLAVQGVYFQCPLLGPDILTKEEWNHKIREFLYDQLNEEKGLVACLIVHTLNKSKQKVFFNIKAFISVKVSENIISLNAYIFQVKLFFCCFK